MPVPAFFQGLESLAIRAKNQIGFIEYVLRPLFKGLTAQLPPVQAMYNNLLANRQSVFLHLSISSPRHVSILSPRVKSTNQPIHHSC